MLNLSPAAIKEISRLHAKYPPAITICRIGVKAGGCSGWYYTLTFDEALHADDIVQPVTGNIRIAVDAQAQPYLEGVTIDYTEDLMGGGFRFENPNALEHCGCGHSFAIDDPPQTNPIHV